MRAASQQKTLQPSLRVLVLLAQILTGTLLTVASQQSPPEIHSPSASPAALVKADSGVTPEDLGDSMLIKGHYQEAVEAFQKVPNASSYVWNKMGIAYQMLFDLKDAVRCYKESLRLKPSNAWALNNLGTVDESMGKYAEAEKLYRQGLQLNPDSARIALNLGTVLMMQNKFSEGAEMYKRALRLNPAVFDEGGLPHSKGDMPLEQRGAMNYYKAQACALAGMNDCAIQFLGRALSEGFTNAEKIALDGNFARLRGDPAFEQLILRRSKP
jgi:tetratricopeptide (TPR) repeat protein